MLFDDKNVAVLDLTHGGIPLAKHIAKAARSVTAIDVYGTVDNDVLAVLAEDGINIEKSVNNNTDLVVAPVHLDPALIPDCGGCPVITHHRAVGELISGTLDSKVVEITGTGAKTSTAALLADMTSRKMPVISHTSRGVEYWQGGVPKKLYHGLSIAPGSILDALEQSSGTRADLYIFEVSLGGTGLADVGIITSLDNEYTIAGGSGNSTEAKMQMVEYARGGSTLLVNAAVPANDPAHEVDTVTFSDTTGEGDVYLENSNSGIWTVHCGNTGDSTIRFMPNSGYDPSAYSTAIVCAAAAAGILGVDSGKIESTLRDFQGVHGRMRMVEFAGRTMVDNSNSGMNIRSVYRALEYSRNLPHSKLVLILGEEARQVCEGLDPGDAARFVSEYGGELDNIILVGERMGDIKGDNISRAEGLNSAIEMAESLTDSNDIIISCVKCFR